MLKHSSLASLSHPCLLWSCKRLQSHRLHRLRVNMTCWLSRGTFYRRSQMSLMMFLIGTSHSGADPRSPYHFRMTLNQQCHHLSWRSTSCFASRGTLHRQPYRSCLWLRTHSICSIPRHPDPLRSSRHHFPEGRSCSRFRGTRCPWSSRWCSTIRTGNRLRCQPCSQRPFRGREVHRIHPMLCTFRTQLDSEWEG